MVRARRSRTCDLHRETATALLCATARRRENATLYRQIGKPASARTRYTPRASRAEWLKVHGLWRKNRRGESCGEIVPGSFADNPADLRKRPT
jgi:hypothetical protein